MTPISAIARSARQDRLRTALAEGGLSGALLFGAPRGLGPATRTGGTVQYFTGWTPMWAPVAAYIPRSGRPLLLVPGKNELRLMRHRVGEAFDIVSLNGRNWGEALADLVSNEADEIGTAGLGEMTIAQAGGLNLARTRPIDADLAQMRMVKAPDELALHEQAVAISEAMVRRALAAAEAGLSPARIMVEVEHEGRMRGADISRLWLSTGAAPPVTYFEAFELPDRLEAGHRLQLGTMVSFEGYFAQTLRIITVGPASEEIRRAHQRLIEMQDVAARAFRVGAPLRDVVDQLESAIAALCPFERGADPFRFQSCHGLGLDYVEPGMAEALSPDRNRDDDVAPLLVAEGMVMEIHPNFTLPPLGHICLGDVAVATRDGGKWLGSLPRSLLEVSQCTHHCWSA